jgi:hypothetical protein
VIWKIKKMGNIICGLSNLLLKVAVDEHEFLINDIQPTINHSKNNEYLSKVFIVTFIADVQNGILRFNQSRPLYDSSIINQHNLDDPNAKCSLIKFSISSITNNTFIPLELSVIWSVMAPFATQKILKNQKIIINPGVSDTHIDIINNSKYGAITVDIAGLEDSPFLTNDLFSEVPVTVSFDKIDEDYIDLDNDSISIYMLSKYMDEFKKHNYGLDFAIYMVISNEKQIYRIKRETYRAFILFMKDTIFSTIQYVEPTEIKFGLSGQSTDSSLKGSTVSMIIMAEIIKCK